MSHWPLSPEDISRPAYRSLAQAIAAAIEAGTLRPGDRLPPHRDMAWRLGVSVQTVSRAYEELIRADFVSGEVGRGSFVKAGVRQAIAMPWHAGDRGSGGEADLALMTPVRLPEIAEAWADTLHRLAGRLHDEPMYALRPGTIAKRYAGLGSAWLARCGLVAGARRILLTNGMTPAMHVALATVANPGDVIATEATTSHTMIPVARGLHLQLRAIPGDRRGMRPEALLAAAREAGGQMKAVFLLPSGAGPRARTMGRERRAELAEAARRAGLMILESDPLGPLAPRRPPPVSSFAPGRSFYFTGMTKCLSPGLRVGMLMMPEGMIEAATNHHLSVAWTVTPLMAEIASDWLENGAADRILLAQRAELAARNRLARRILGDRTLGGLHGLHRWMPLPEGSDEAAFQRLALRSGVAVAAGATFAVAAPAPAIRVCLGATARGELERALGTLASLLPEAAPEGSASGLSGSAKLS